MIEDELCYVIVVDFIVYLLSVYVVVYCMKLVSDMVVIGLMSVYVLGLSLIVYVGIKVGIVGFLEVLCCELGLKGICVVLVELGKIGLNM